MNLGHRFFTRINWKRIEGRRVLEIVAFRRPPESQGRWKQLTRKAIRSILSGDLNPLTPDRATRDENYHPRYLGFLESFGRGRFFEAHEVLEALWLPQRQGPNGPFYKGLIQLAGAFVHWQKNRPGPAVALFGLARANLRKYPATHQGLNVERVLAMIEDGLRQLAAAAPGACPPVPASWCRLLTQGCRVTGSREAADV